MFQAEVLSQIWNLVQQCDQTTKTVTVSYFQLQHAVMAPLPVQVSTQYHPLYASRVL